MTLRERLESGLKEAMKSGDRVAVSAIRLLLSEVKNAEIDKRRPLEEAEIVQALRSGLKKRQEAIEMFAKGGRQDLVDRESAEAAVLERFLPAGLSAAELEALVVAAIAETGASSPKDMGRVMKVVVPRVAGRADGAEVSRIVKERLSAPR